MALFESYERRIDKINGVLAQYGIGSVEECRELCKAKGFDPYEIVKGIQPICFENACWAYTVGAAIALKSGVTTAAEAAKKIGEGLQSFCIDGSVAEDRKVGLGHGNLGAMLLSEESKCFAFLAGHESFAAAEGAIGIVRNANKARKTPLRVILNGLGSVGSGGHVLLQSDGGAHAVRPGGVLKADGLDALDDVVGVEASGLADVAALLHAGNSVLSQDGIDLVDSSLVAFKQSHWSIPPFLIPDGDRYTSQRHRTDHSGPWPSPWPHWRRCPS